MIKSTIKIGDALAKGTLRVAEKVDKTTQFDGQCTHINVLIPIKEDMYRLMPDTQEVSPVLIHAGTSVTRYKSFDLAKVVDQPIVANIFFAQ